MKKLLLIAILLISAGKLQAQNPVIVGDTMLCPDGDGTASVINDMEYDSYQWQVKFYGEPAFEDVDGETESEFTYDAYNYSVAEIRVKAMLGTETYFSNILAIDSMVFLPIFYFTETDGGVEFNPNNEGYLMCPGGTITNTVEMPYTIVQWYKDGEPIDGATEPTYVIAEPGTYYAIAAPEECPESYDTTLPTVVTLNPDCVMGPEPTIAGNTMLCPGGEGTAGLINNMNYNSYQWQVKFYGDTTFADVDGETGPAFTYDAFNYSLAQIRLKVTLNTETYYSNILEIDSMVFLPVFYFTETDGQAEFDPDSESYLICPGATITNTVGMPYTIVQWYKDGELIDGANDISYTITEPGVYHAVAAPGDCPANSQTTLPTVVLANMDCALGTGDSNIDRTVAIYPNPANEVLKIRLPQSTMLNRYSIIDSTGKIIFEEELPVSKSIDISTLAQGTYLVRLTGDGQEVTKMLVRK